MRLSAYLGLGLGTVLTCSAFTPAEKPGQLDSLKHPHEKRGYAPGYGPYGYSQTLCDGETQYIEPYCHTDAQCQQGKLVNPKRPQTSNLTLTGFKAIDAEIRHGHGFCTKHGHCGVEIDAHDDLVGYCKEIVELWQTGNKGIIYVNACMDPENPGRVQCDTICDPTIDPLCNHPYEYDFPCSMIQTGGNTGSGTPGGFGCPGSKVPEGYHYPGDPTIKQSGKGGSEGGGEGGGKKKGGKNPPK